YSREESVALVLSYFAFGFVAADLFIERVEQLLSGGRAGEGGAMVEGTAETAVVQQALWRAVKHDAHAIEKIDDAGRSFTHSLDQWLIRQKIAAVDSVIKMFSGGVAFAFLVLCCVDATLRADRVRTFYWDNREEIDRNAGLGHLDGCHQSSQSST